MTRQPTIARCRGRCARRDRRPSRRIAGRSPALGAAAAGPRIEITIAAGRPRRSRRPAWSTSRSAATTSARRSSRPIRPGCRSSRSPSTVCSPARRSRITAAERGHPIASLRDIPAGDYWVQPFVNVYTRFRARRRQDGLAAHGSVGRPELEAVAGQHLRRAGAGHVRSAVDGADPARRRQGDPADHSRRPTPSWSSGSRSRARS